MQKQAPTAGRLIVMVAFALSCFGLLLFLWIAFGGATPLKPKGYRFDVSFAEATQLAVEADVRISGVPVGKVKEVEAKPDTGRSVATIEIDERYAPVPRDARAILRQKTLLGETYVELTPGTGSAGTIPEGGELARGRVSPTVELDEIFRAFDAPTREAFQTWMQQQARGIRGRARDLSDILGNLEPFAEDATELLRVLRSQEGAVRQVVRDTDPLVDQLRPAARELSPTLQSLSALAPDLEALFRDLDPLITASRTGIPAVQRFLEDLRPALGEFDPVLKQLNPIASWLGEHRSELRAFFANVPAATQATTPDGVHYLRTTNPQNPEAFAAYPRRIGSNRTNPYMKPRGFDHLDRVNEADPGLLSYETRHCGRPNPTTDPAGALADALRQVLPILQQPPPEGPPNPLAPPPPTAESLADAILTFGFNNAGRDVPAPPCVFQGPFRTAEGELVPAGGELTQYPHVREAPSSTSNPDSD